MLLNIANWFDPVSLGISVGFVIVFYYVFKYGFVDVLKTIKVVAEKETDISLGDCAVVHSSVGEIKGYTISHVLEDTGAVNLFVTIGVVNDNWCVVGMPLFDNEKVKELLSGEIPIIDNEDGLLYVENSFMNKEENIRNLFAKIREISLQRNLEGKSFFSS
jgi:hypothetical protein